MKKTLSLLTAIALLALSLISCSSLSNICDILLDNLRTEGYSIDKLNKEEILTFCDRIGAENVNIEDILVTSPGDDPYQNEKMGCFVYCATKDDAEKLHKVAKAFVENDPEFRSFIKNPSARIKLKIVYLGSESTWEKFE